MSPMLYSTLALAGIFTMDELSHSGNGAYHLRAPGKRREKGIENTSGPLGQGHAMALGAAIAERFLAARFGEWLSHKTYAYISDGGIQEEISQVWDVWLGIMACTISLCSMIPMTYSRHSDVSSEDTALKYQARDGMSLPSRKRSEPDKRCPKKSK